VIGVGLLLSIGHLPKDLGPRLRGPLALAGIGLASASLIGLWISETSSLFGFTDHGYRAAIVAAILAEATAIVALGGYLAIAGRDVLRPWPRLRTR
jgi:hypothetical protein